MTARDWLNKRRVGIKEKLQKMMKCIFSGEQQLTADETVDSSESLATRDYTASGYSSRAAEVDTKVDNSNIEEAESSLRESGYLNYEEARALLGRLEYQKGNIEAALHVFEGIDIATVTPKMRISIAKKYGNYRRRSQGEVAPPPMSMHAVSLLFEAIFLKAKSLERLGRFSEAAQTCKIMLDTVESALPDGLPESFSADCKLQETLNKVVKSLPELWKLSGDYQEAILSYRKGLLFHWNLDVETKAKIQKEFAIFLLYSGVEACPPNLRWQIDRAFVPRNNIEEAVLLFVILVRKFSLGRLKWDHSILDHLTFALSVSGGLQALAHQVEELLPGILERNERYWILALCYYGEGENTVALNLLRNLLANRENPDCIMELLLASKICGDNAIFVEEGIEYAQKVIKELAGGCSQKASVANCLLGVLLSVKSRLVSSDIERNLIMSKALESLEAAEKTMERDPYVVYHLSVQNAEQRKMDLALYHAKQLLKLEAGSSVRVYILLARILSAQSRFSDAETVINAALDQMGKWEQGELLRTKAKLQIAQGQLKNAIETYSQLLAVLQVQAKSSGFAKRLSKNAGQRDRSLEAEAWNDLTAVYTSLSQWRDAEACLAKSKAISPFSTMRLHNTGLLYQAQGQYQDALKAFQQVLDLEPNHVKSLVSIADILRRLGTQSLPVIRSLLTDAIRLDRTNASAWYNLGLVYKDDPGASALEAAECFEAAALLEESAPVEPFR